MRQRTQSPILLRAVTSRTELGLRSLKDWGIVEVDILPCSDAAPEPGGCGFITSRCLLVAALHSMTHID